MISNGDFYLFTLDVIWTVEIVVNSVGNYYRTKFCNQQSNNINIYRWFQRRFIETVVAKYSHWAQSKNGRC